MSENVEELYQQLIQMKKKEELQTSAFTDDLIAYYKNNPLDFLNTELSFKGKPVMRSPQTDQFILDWSDYSIDKIIVVAGRGCGKTFTCAEAALLTSVTIPYVETVVVGGSQEQSRKLYGYVKHFITRNPRLANMVVGKPKMSETVFSNGSVIKALPCSETKVRGPHPNILFLDEVAAADKAGKTQIIEAAIDSLSGATNIDDIPIPRIVMTSTAHHASGKFVDVWSNAKLYGYKRYKWAAGEVNWETRKVTKSFVPWIPIVQIQNALESKEKDSFLVEWMGALKGSMSRVFSEEDIDAAIQIKSKRFDIHPEETLRIGGIDWASARPTNVVVVEKYDGFWWVIDAFSIGERSISGKAQTIKAIGNKYRVAEFYADAGDPSANSRVMELGINVRAVGFAHQKDLMMGVLKRGFEGRVFRLPFDIKSQNLMEFYRQLKMYHYDDKERFAKGNDDYIDAMALAMYPYRGELVPIIGDGGLLLDVDEVLQNLGGDEF